MTQEITQQQRTAAASQLADKAELAARCGSRARAAELAEVAMLLDPSPDRIRTWLMASAQTGSATHRQAMLEVGSWF